MWAPDWTSRFPALVCALFLSTSLCGTPVSPPQATGQEEIEVRIQRIVNSILPAGDDRSEPANLAERMAHHRTPGVSVAVIKGSEIEWARGFGLCEAGRPDPVTEKTLFQAASVSKPVFAAAVMRLSQEGRLDLDRDVNGYLTSWKLPHDAPGLPVVTLRLILSHTAGLNVSGFPGYAVDQKLPTLTEILDGKPPANTPAVRVQRDLGGEFHYSGGGTTVAQLALTDLLRLPFPEIMRRLILDPLEMHDSTFDQPLAEGWSSRAATGHPFFGRPLEGKWRVHPEMAAAGLWTTPSDLARFGIEIQKAIKGTSNRIVNRRWARQMLSSQARSPGLQRVGLGFFLTGSGKTSRFGHTGSNVGYISRMTLYRELGLGAVIMINSNQGAALASEIERAIAREYGWPDYFPQ